MWSVTIKTLTCYCYFFVNEDFLWSLDDANVLSEILYCRDQLRRLRHHIPFRNHSLRSPEIISFHRLICLSYIVLLMFLNIISIKCSVLMRGEFAE